MAPKNARNGHHSKVCNNGDAQPSRRDALDEDAIALESAQNELKAVSQSVEQLLEVMRTGNGEQLEALVAATRSGVPQEEILAMVRQYTQEKERTLST